MTRASNLKVALLLGGSLLAGVPAHAADLVTKAPVAAPGSAAPVPWLLGDWGGARTRLQQQGVDFTFAYTSEAAYNATGGIRSGGAYTDQYVAGVNLDLDRLLGIHDAQFKAVVTERTGRNLGDDVQLGTLQLVQEVWGRGQTARLTAFWFDQKYFNGLLDWKVGRVTVGEDFASFSCDFQNLTFCGSNPGNLVGNYILNWPTSQWGTRLKVALGGFGYFQVGAYDINPQYLGVRDAVLPVFFPGSTGVLVPVELAWLPKFGGGALPGSYKFGAWYDTSTASDVVSDIRGGPAALSGLPALQQRGRYGGYINFLQQVTRTESANPQGGLSLFLNAVMADDRTATTDRQIAGGMIYTGPFSARPDDDIAFAVGTTHVNRRLADVAILQNLALPGSATVRNSEYVFEAYYSYRPMPGLTIRPNIQYIVTPGGTSQNKDALVFGLKTSAVF